MQGCGILSVWICPDRPNRVQHLFKLIYEAHKHGAETFSVLTLLPLRQRAILPKIQNFKHRDSVDNLKLVCNLYLSYKNIHSNTDISVNVNMQLFSPGKEDQVCKMISPVFNCPL